MKEQNLSPDFRWTAMVPELIVLDLQASLAFWCGLLGFAVAYARPEERFAYLHLGDAQIMIEELQPARQWITGALEHPLGRGINFQVEVASCEPILDRLAGHRWPLFRDIEERWYQAGTVEAGVRQFLVQDPDGYLVRLQEALGTRPSVGAGAAA